MYIYHIYLSHIFSCQVIFSTFLHDLTDDFYVTPFHIQVKFYMHRLFNLGFNLEFMHVPVHGSGCLVTGLRDGPR